MKTKSQKERIEDYLLKGHKITPLQALNWFGCLRLGARIWELKKAGINISSKMIKTKSGKMVKQYWLEAVE